jgi:uncharacterized repeat protein (TIGR04061 family)
MTPLSPAPVRIDAELYHELANPARQELYPRESRGYVRIDVSIRTYWHTLFDTVPRLLDLTGPDGKAIFLPYMDWARDQKLSFNWTYFLWVYKWLQQSEFRDRLDTDLLLKMMSASASRWLGFDRDTDHCGIVLGSRSLPGAAVVGWKVNSVNTQIIRVERTEFEDALPAPDEEFGYFFTPGFALDHFPGWRPIPR